LAISIGLLIISLFSACGTTKKMESEPCLPDTIYEWALAHRIDTMTIIEPWHTVEYVDTTMCPPCRPDTVIIRKTIYQDTPGDIIFQERIDTVRVDQNGAQVKYLANLVKEYEIENSAYRKERNWLIAGVLTLSGLWLLWLIGLLLMKLRK
jgi:hypothetical protein